MKKNTILGAALSVILAATSLTSCNNCGSSCSLNNDVDSLSYAQGLLVGKNIAPQLSYDPKMDKDQFLKGFKKGLAADSSEYSFRIGESVGFNISSNMERDITILGVTMDKEVFLKAFIAGVNGDSTLFNDMEANTIVNTIMESLMAKKRAAEEARLSATPEAQENLAKGEAFLAQKATEEGVMKTESGLLYKVIKAGKGENATASDRITMNYKGTLIDGTQFDQNNGASGVVSQFVPGFSEGLQLMNKGAKYEFYIPAKLGYGALVQGQIPSNSVLIFEVELTDIAK